MAHCLLVKQTTFLTGVPIREIHNRRGAASALTPMPETANIDRTCSVAIGSMASPSTRLCLVAHEDTRLLAAVADTLATRSGWQRVALGVELAARLRDLSHSVRPGQVRPLLAQILPPYGLGPLICTEIDLIFEPALYLDPLSLLGECSRLARLVVLWPGKYTADRLTYAVPEHSHFRIWPAPQYPTRCVSA